MANRFSEILRRMRGNDGSWDEARKSSGPPPLDPPEQRRYDGESILPYHFQTGQYEHGCFALPNLKESVSSTRGEFENFWPEHCHKPGLDVF